MTRKANTLKTLTTEIRQTFQDLSAYGSALHEPLGVNASMGAVMEALARNGAQTAPEIASRKNVSRQHIQKIINQLLAGDFAVRRDNPEHKRSSLIALSPKGRRAFAKIQSREQEEFEKLATMLSDKNMTSAVQTLRDLRQALAAQDTALTKKETSHDG